MLAYGQADNAAAAGATAQAMAAAQAIAIGYIKPDVQANKASSAFVVASGKQAALAPYFRRFLINCDQWDGYNAERKALMSHLKSNNIGNVVALTGDIHSFFAGTVSDDFDAANGGTPVAVDLVTAGVSSDSFFTYLRDAAAALGDLGTLVSYPLSVPVPGLGTLALNFNLLDYTLGRAAPTVDTLAAQVSVQLRGALAAKGLPEAALDATVEQVLAGLKANGDFNTALLGLAQQLAGLSSNPWLKHLNTDAQGFTVVTVTPGRGGGGYHRHGYFGRCGCGYQLNPRPELVSATMWQTPVYGRGLRTGVCHVVADTRGCRGFKGVLSSHCRFVIQ
ncbi:alkaline phosphatase D family protein [Pseudoduganella sp. UC29_106]|uniref:alkaline phosphatase D family protein n=1 Tax=Pseudoduganella sp. UC29_106 TaxID=3374553 RepID=UPI003756C025